MSPRRLLPVACLALGAAAVGQDAPPDKPRAVTEVAENQNVCATSFVKSCRAWSALNAANDTPIRVAVAISVTESAHARRSAWMRFVTFAGPMKLSSAEVLSSSSTASPRTK